MYCQNCGKEIADKAIVCIHCGCATQNNNDLDRNMVAAILLWFFLGAFGAHRYYLGHALSATLMLLCLLFCWLIIPALILGIWWIIDIILIVSGGLKPKNGGRLI